jgi:D-aspartate ligase
MPRDGRRKRVVVLEGGATSLAVVRCLAEGRFDTRVVSFEPRDVCRYSRLCRHFVYRQSDVPDELFARWLVETFQAGPGRPLLIPTSDATAIFATEYAGILEQAFLLTQNSAEDMRRIVSKDELYGRALRAGLNVPPYVIAPDEQELADWMGRYEPPYIVKPFFATDGNSPIPEKNRTFGSSDALRNFCSEFDLQSLIIQQRLKGGDGNIFDCYGLCDRNGEMRVGATHLRIRQTYGGAGVTSYGEIPVVDAPFDQSELIRNTQILFRELRYHGIFGVEWLWDIRSETLNLLDVNARPFSSIGHLCDSGLNLPHLLVREMFDEDISVSPQPSLTHSYWIDFSRDAAAAIGHVKAGHLTVGHWIRDMWRARSYGYWTSADPMPFVVAWLKFAKKALRAVTKRIF